MRTFLHRLHDEAGEGVISTGIAILIMAVIGAAMFAVFSTMMDDTAEDIDGQLETITNG